MRSALLMLLFIVPVALFGQDVNVQELSSTKNTAVEFVNYEGPYSKYETRAEITGIGVYLGTGPFRDLGKRTYAGKYEILHAVDPQEKTGFDADIFSILPAAEVDHIQNVRLILSGYLMTAYRYSSKDAQVLAEYITIYNAVYRGKFSELQQKYKKVVIDHLRPDAAGIATVYSQWPGKTQMLIPLTSTAAQGGVGSLSTDTLSSNKVVQQLRSQPGMGLEARKGMTEIKSKEVEKAQQQIQQQEQTLQQEKQQIAQQQKSVAEQQQKLATAPSTPENQAAQRKLQQTAQNLASQAQSVAKQETALATKEQAVSQRAAQIQQERQQIASDQQTLIKQQNQQAAKTSSSAAPAATSAKGSAAVPEATASAVSSAAAQVLPYLIVTQATGEPLGVLVLVDPTTGKITEKSLVNSIRKQRFQALQGGYLVLAGTTSGRGAVRLMLLDGTTLATKATGTTDIFPESDVLVAGTSIYAVVGAGNKWYVARFDQSLAEVGRSEIAVVPYTTLVASGSSILAVADDNTLHELDSKTLKDQRSVQ